MLKYNDFLVAQTVLDVMEVLFLPVGHTRKDIGKRLPLFLWRRSDPWFIIPFKQLAAWCIILRPTTLENIWKDVNISVLCKKGPHSCLQLAEISYFPYLQLSIDIDRYCNCKLKFKVDSYWKWYRPQHKYFLLKKKSSLANIPENIISLPPWKLRCYESNSFWWKQELETIWKRWNGLSYRAPLP